MCCVRYGEREKEEKNNNKKSTLTFNEFKQKWCIMGTINTYFMYPCVGIMTDL